VSPLLSPGTTATGPKLMGIFSFRIFVKSGGDSGDSGDTPLFSILWVISLYSSITLLFFPSGDSSGDSGDIP
jgi:hypothetical protein